MALVVPPLPILQWDWGTIVRLGEVALSVRDGVQEVHGQVAAEVALLIPQIHDAVAELASALAAAGSDEGPAGVEVMNELGVRFIAQVRPLVLGISERLASDLPLHVGPLERWDHWADRIRHFLAYVVEYGEGWVDGGGVALAVLTGCQEGGWTDPDALRRLLADRLAFLHYRVEAAAVQWAQEVANELNPAGARRTPSPSAARPGRSTAPAVQREHTPPRRPPEPPSDEGEPPEPFSEPLDARPPIDRPSKKALAEAPTAGFRHPALDRGAPIPVPHAPDSPEERKARFDELMAFADELKVRVKKAPELPSTKWLDKMEEKLTEMAVKRGVHLPAGFGAPTAEFDTGRGEAAESGMSDDERRERIDAMLAKAEKAGLKLGRVPKDPSDAWLLSTEEQLEAMLEARRNERKAERERKAAERQARIDRLKQDAETLDVDLGPFPGFPTDEWLGRAELRIAQVMLAREPAPVDELAEDDSELLAVGEAESEEPSEGPEIPEPTIPVLLYEEGSVQEEAWVMSGDRMTIGRARGSDVQILHDAGISRQHCAIERQADGTFALIDLGSTKGTLVNGMQVRGQTRLLPGALVQVGETELVFRLRG